MIHIIEINNVKVWLYIDQLRIINEKTKEIKLGKIFLCYFKFTEPTPFVLGELINDNGIPKLFESSDNAIEFAKKYIQERFDL